MHLDGLLSEEEMTRHPEKARLLKAVGGPRTPSITLGEETLLQRGDTLLLCTDGLWEALAAEELAGFLGYNLLEEGVEEMLLSAENRMKQKADNVSAIAFRWEDDVTRAVPLQAHGSKEADHRSLLEEPRLRAATRKTRTEEAPKDEARNSLEAKIDELEAFLARFEKH